jgi:hypothetical protein
MSTEQPKMAGPILIDRNEARSRMKRQVKPTVVEVHGEEQVNLKLNELDLEIQIDGEKNNSKVESTLADDSQVSSITKFAKPSPLHCPVSNNVYLHTHTHHQLLSNCFFFNIPPVIQQANVLLKGSVPLPTTTSVLTILSKSFPSMTRLPDGETGIRKNYIFFQLAVFSQCPWVLTPFELYEEQGVHEREEKTIDVEASVDSTQAAKKEINLNDTGYATAALASYEEFKKARDEGIIGKGVRFQVSMPMPFEVPAFCILPEFQGEVEKLYTEKLVEDLKAIQNAIPAEDLAIQFDVPFAIAMLEGLVTPWFAKDRDELKQQLAERFKKMASFVKEGVEMGFHLCYGDYKHQHFMEPKDTALLVELNNLIQGSVERNINWVHLPVPKSRVDVEYFEPLKVMDVRRRGETELYLGLVHANDCEGTKKRIEIAEKVLGSRCFGVGTECGWGRHGDEEFESMLEVSESVV